MKKRISKSVNSVKRTCALVTTILMTIGTQVFASDDTLTESVFGYFGDRDEVTTVMFIIGAMMTIIGVGLALMFRDKDGDERTESMKKIIWLIVAGLLIALAIPITRVLV